MILIDDRAGSRDLHALAPLTSISQLCRLDSADVCFSGNGPTSSLLVGIEFKSLSDLLTSAANGRIQATQAPAMIAAYDICYLLYYGEYRSCPDTGSLQYRDNRRRSSGFWLTYRMGKRTVPYGYLESFLLTLSALGFRIKHCTSLDQSAEWLACLYRWWSKPWSDHRGLHTFDNSSNVSLMPGMDESTYVRAKIAASLPGVGFQRALAAARHFSSVREMVNAPASEWSKVDGIGKVVAKAVQAALD